MMLGVHEQLYFQLRAKRAPAPLRLPLPPNADDIATIAQGAVTLLRLVMQRLPPIQAFPPLALSRCRPSNAGSSGGMAEADCFTFNLPPDLRLRVLSLLPPNDLALGGRLSCKDAAQRFSEPHHRTARLGQPLHGHAITSAGARAGESAAEGAEGGGGAPVEHASRAVTQLNFRQKLRLVTTAAASGCEANVEFALQLLQSHVFPELLHTDHYLGLMQEGQPRQRQGTIPPSPATDVGSAVVASGLAHLLPSLAQRCPGLLDPGATLEAAALHLSLAGLQAAWEAVGHQLTSRLQLQPRRQPVWGPALDLGFMAPGISMGQGFNLAQLQSMALSTSEACKVWRRVMVAAACSPAAGSTAKLEWALDKSRVTATPLLC